MASPRRWVLPLFFCLVAFAVFLEQTWPYWHQGELLAGIHADGPFHFYNAAARLSPEYFPKDLAVQSNRDLGFYEYFYGSLNWLVNLTGASLLKTNLAVCWVGNFLYLGGVMVLLWRLKLSAWTCALGTLLAAQPFVLTGGMSSGVIHSLAIPREVWLWPMPWLVGWFIFGKRAKARLLIFYGLLGAVYGFTYPLWAALLGLAFGLVDAVRIVRQKNLPEVVWLFGAALLCVGLVSAPSLATFRVVGGEESAVLDYNQITRSMYFSKGFRRLLLFSAAGLGALWLRRRGKLNIDGPLSRLWWLLTVALLVCCVYEPFQRLWPTLSLVYPGRLSLVAYLASMVAVAAWLHHFFRAFPVWGKAAVMAGVLFVCIDPVRSLRREMLGRPLPAQTEFVQFSRLVKARTGSGALALIEPTVGTHYFRVYAERGLWINPKDLGVLSRTRSTYAIAQDRLRTLNVFYEKATPSTERESLLQKFRKEGVDYVITRADEDWPRSLSWPVVEQSGRWQLRSPQP